MRLLTDITPPELETLVSSSQNVDPGGVNLPECGIKKKRSLHATASWAPLNELI